MPNPKAPERAPEAAKAHATPAKSSERKRWIKKTPLDVVAEQADKLRTEVERLEEELQDKRAQLQKFEEFRKSVLGS